MSFWVTETVDSELLKAAHWAGGAASAAIDATRSCNSQSFQSQAKTTNAATAEIWKVEKLELAFHYMSGYQ